VVQDEANAPGTSGEKAAAKEVEFADVDGTGVRSNALEFARASRMVRRKFSMLQLLLLVALQLPQHLPLLHEKI
jgi:hypothetical protein